MNYSIEKRISTIIIFIALFAMSFFSIILKSSIKNFNGESGKVVTEIKIEKNNVEREDLWTRPDGPLRVGLQVGHWKNNELPDELERLRKRGGGTQGGGKAEWEVNLEIAKEVASLLEEKGIAVDILPATVPENYWADVFLSIHADGSEDASTNGFKVAAPWRDVTGKSIELARLIENRYQQVTKMRIDPNVTRNMRGYYAFNWRRYEHSIHPMSTAVIIETGFLTNLGDRMFLINKTDIVAQGISKTLIEFFELS